MGLIGRHHNVRSWVTLCLLAIMATGCAGTRNPADPWEPVNRTVFAFNEDLDRVAVKPLATAYSEVMPPPVRVGVTNFFGNFRDFTTAVNSFLQLKIPRGFSDTARVLVNSTVGILGVFDVASRVGLEKHNEDFGQTLGYWGAGTGPYMVLPLFGPSTVRDTVGLVGDYFTDPEFFLINEAPANYIVFTTRLVNVRANLLQLEGVLNQAALDRYAFVRDAYLQRRFNQVHDGNPPQVEPEDGAPPHRKTLKELEEELGLEPEMEEPIAPPTNQ